MWTAPKETGNVLWFLGEPIEMHHLWCLRAILGMFQMMLCRVEVQFIETPYRCRLMPYRGIFLQSLPATFSKAGTFWRADLENVVL